MLVARKQLQLERPVPQMLIDCHSHLSASQVPHRHHPRHFSVVHMAQRAVLVGRLLGPRIACTEDRGASWTWRNTRGANGTFCNNNRHKSLFRGPKTSILGLHT